MVTIRGEGVKRAKAKTIAAIQRMMASELRMRKESPLALGERIFSSTGVS